MAIEVRYVARDGTLRRGGIRVRAAPGHGDGSLSDDYLWGEITPLDGDRALQSILDTVKNERLRAFVRSLPVARTVPNAVLSGRPHP